MKIRNCPTKKKAEKMGNDATERGCHFFFLRGNHSFFPLPRAVPWMERQSLAVTDSL
jgi:hypothetical protein